MIYSWKIKLKPGESPLSDDGKFMAQRTDDGTGYVVKTSRACVTREEAEYQVDPKAILYNPILNNL